jgi:hypothetical protein
LSKGVVREVIAIESRQSIIRRYPDGTVVVLTDVRHTAARQQFRGKEPSIDGIDHQRDATKTNRQENPMHVLFDFVCKITHFPTHHHRFLSHNHVKKGQGNLLSEVTGSCLASALR